MRVPNTKYAFTPLLLFWVALLLGGCSGKQTLRGVFQKQTPHERYEQGLRSANLHETGLGRDWIAASQRALSDSISISLPFRETGYFRADRAMAASYRFRAPEGQVVSIAVTSKSREPINIFLDLFELPDNPSRAPRLVASADSAATTLEYRLDNSRTHLLRLQPELLRPGQYTITIVSRPSLAFPVQGKDSKAVLSRFGVDRDGGARRHEGIDIFASRGTPAIAAVEGRVTRVSETPRGGKVVWLSDVGSRQNLYYAHLDRQLVQPGQQVKVGDTLGLVGNTGNAITTAPHLHFGIYKFGLGAIDPYAYVHQPSTNPGKIQANLEQLGEWVRTSVPSANLRLSPNNKASRLGVLFRHTPVQVLGGTDTWYRVRTPDGLEGYVAANLVENLEKPIRRQMMQPEFTLLAEPAPDAAPLDSSRLGQEVPVLASYRSYLLVQDSNGDLGWLLTPLGKFTE